MKILITGATGLIGSKLIEKLLANDKYNIAILTRDIERAKSLLTLPIDYFEWNPNANYIDNKALLDVDIIIHLAGENIANKRWSKSVKNKIISSRQGSTQLLLDAIKTSGHTPKKVISASAIGYYGDRRDEQLNEASPKGNGFLADTCAIWENVLHEHSFSSMQTHSLRIGVVLSNQGGALTKMLPFFKYGLGSKLGSGKQYMSWIHIDDLIQQFIFLIEHNIPEKTLNAVTPNPVSNKDFSKALAKTYSMPLIFTIPHFILKTLLGEMSTIILDSQKVSHSKFIDHGFKYQYATLEKSFNHLLQNDVKSEGVIEQFQWFNQSIEEVFNFFSNEKNLERITPDILNFKVLSKSTENIEAGTLINYKLSLHGIPIKWVTKIERFEKNKLFVDTQIKGPYKKWHHTHSFKELKNGTLMKDHIIYKLPFGKLGQLIAGSFVKNDIKKIFTHRKKTMAKILGEKE